MRRLLALSGPAAAAVLTVSWIVAGQAAGGYSPLREDLSVLAARGTAPGVALSAAIAIAGGATVAVAGALAGRGGGATRRVAAALLGLAGVLVAALTALPIACSEGADPACRARAAAGLMPWQDSAHNVAVGGALAAVLAAQACLALGPRRAAPGLPRGAWAGLLAATGTAAAAYLAGPLPAWSGLLERAVVTLVMAFVAAVALAVLREGDGPPGRARERSGAPRAGAPARAATPASPRWPAR